jgi:hypothetical protein
MSKYLNNRDRHHRASFDKSLSRCIRIVESQPNLATLRLCESVCESLTTLLESIRLTIEDRPRKNDLVMLRDRIQELSFERANESLNAPKYHSEYEEPFTPADDEDETQIFGTPSNDDEYVRCSEATYGSHSPGETGDYGTVNMTDIGTESPDYPIDVLKDQLRMAVARLRDSSTRNDVTPYTLASIAGIIDTAVSKFDKEVGS